MCVFSIVKSFGVEVLPEAGRSRAHRVDKHLCTVSSTWSAEVKCLFVPLLIHFISMRTLAESRLR